MGNTNCFHCNVCFYRYKLDENASCNNKYMDEIINKRKKICYECYKLSPYNKSVMFIKRYHETVIKKTHSDETKIKECVPFAW